MDQFLQPKWQYLALIDMRCCEIDDKMWSQLSNNIDNFPNLIQLDLTLNRIVTVVQSDLTKFNHLKRFKLVSIADNPLSIESRKVLGRWRPTLKIQKQAVVEFSWLDIKHKQFKFSNLAKKQPLLMNLIQRISFAKKEFDYNQWQAVVFYMKQFPLMIELDLSGNQIVQIKFQDLEKINFTIQKRNQVLNQKLTLDLMGNKLSQESYKQIQLFYEVYPYSSLILKSISTPELFHSERLRLLPVKNIYRVLLEMDFKNHELKQQITEELFETITEQFLIQLNNNWQFQKARTKYLELWGYVESQFIEVHKPKIKEKHLNNFKELLNSLQIPFNKAKLVYEGLFL